jgi:hypothetical protein
MVVTAILGPAPSALAGEHSVPITGHYEAMITSATPALDGLHVTDVGEGNATHLGTVDNLPGFLLQIASGIVTEKFWGASQTDGGEGTRDLSSDLV